MKKIDYYKNFLSPNIRFVIFSLVSLFLFFLLIFLFKYGSMTLLNKKGLTKNNYNMEGNRTGNLLITKAPTFKEKIAEPILNGPESVLGDKNAPISIIEYSDFSCSFCAKQDNVIEEIIKQYSRSVKLIWKDYPENNPDSPSYQAAVAGRCAEEQGEFWDYRKILHQESHNLNNDTFLEIADELALKTNDFKECLKSERAKTLIDKNIEEANDLGIPGIPFTYINKLGLIGEMTFEEIKNMIEIELQKIK